MSEGKKYVLAVPNFSNGRDPEVVAKVTEPVKEIPGVKLVGVEPEHDFNRTVVTVIGEPGPIKKALVEMGARAAKLVDMSRHQGTHPRIGAEDTLPIFPLHNITLDECRALAEEIGKEFFELTKVPVYFAGVNSRTPERASFAFIRAGQYEGLRDLLRAAKNDPARAAEYEARRPDLSVDGLLSETAGGTIVSCEENGLTAYNIFLDTEDLSVAKEIARAVRGPSGGFGSVRAVGIKFPEHKGVVVSMNMFDCVSLPIQRVFEFCRREAARLGVNVAGSQLVGPIKLESVIQSFVYSLGLEGFRTGQILESHLIGLK
ncbi:MAG: glutamate formimidoyltransferase [Deltaproteobacteria bacterium]|jgi:glutamate formiminotransferase/formiminotetrahydrofolate cyclodeaminase|nr:glutamate formimidoyltransferase [Deltaproteobacteria bacterium]